MPAEKTKLQKEMQASQPGSAFHVCKDEYKTDDVGPPSLLTGLAPTEANTVQVVFVEVTYSNCLVIETQAEWA